MSRSRRAFLAAGLGAAALRGGPPAAPDRAFARLVDELSGPETGPTADNLMSNEDSFPRIARDLARAAPRGSAYLGVGPDQNLTYVAHARPALAFILDHRRRNLLVHLLHKALMAVAPDRAGYLARLTARAPARPVGPEATAEDLVAAFGPGPVERARLDAAVAEVAAALGPLGVVRDDEWPALATIQARLAGPGLGARFLALRMYPTLARLMTTPARDGRPAHFLAVEALYRSARDLEGEDRVVPVVGDFAAAAPLPRLGDRLRRLGLAVGVLYISDVEFFLLRAGRFAAYAENLGRLPWADGAVVVRTSTREIDHPDRVAGDGATTVIRPAGRFLADARAGRIRGVDDLFRP